MRLLLLACMTAALAHSKTLISPNDLAKCVLEYVAVTPVVQPGRARHAPSANRAGSSSTRPALSKHITLLHSPPAPADWTRLCEDVTDGGAAALAAHVSEQRCALPDVQGSAGSHCQLGRRPYAHRLKQELLSAYVAALFHSLVAGRAAAARRLGAPAPALSRFDLFHGHIFVARGEPLAPDSSSQGTPRERGSGGAEAAGAHMAQNSTKQQQQKQQQRSQGAGWWPDGTRRRNSTGGTRGQHQGPRLGILFHAAEYPAYSDSAFPINLGHCQHNSTCGYHPRSMDLRNMLWYNGKLAVLDVGLDSPLHELLHEGTEPLRTLYEEDFGQPVADLLLLQDQQRRRRRSLRAAQALEQRRWHGFLASGRALRACIGSQRGVYVSY